MPIDYKRYPPDWKQIVQRIHERAGSKCEVCGLENGSWVFGAFMWIRDQRIARYKRKAIWSTDEGLFLRMDAAGLISNYKKKRVVLTIAHLDHDEENHQVTDDRLMCMCQYCHLNYDAVEKYQRQLRIWEKKKNLSGPEQSSKTSLML